MGQPRNFGSIAAIAGCLVVASQARAATLTVCPSGCDFTTIAAAVTAANANDIIELGAITHTEANIVIASKNLTVRGQGVSQTILQARPSNVGSGVTLRVFNPTGTTVLTIEDMTLRYGRVSSGNGGTILGANTASVVLRRCVVEDSAASVGGALYLTGPLTVEDSVFRRCSGGQGGAIYLAFGASLVMTDSLVEENSGQSGGGIFASSGGSVQVTDTVFRNNDGCINPGPAIFSDSPVTLTRVHVFGSNCTSSTSRAVWVENSLTMTDSVVEANVAAGGVRCQGTSTITRSIIRGNAYGGIENLGDLTVIDSTVTGNEVPGFGGGIASSGNLVVRNSSIVGNAAGVSGGGIAAGSSSVVVLDNVTIAGNHAADQGGGLHVPSGGTSLRNTLIADNTTEGLGPDCHGTIHSLGFNLIENRASCFPDSDQNNVYGVDPQLGLLVDNGGPTPTKLLLNGSPAIDSGSCLDSAGATVAFDQRGVARPIGATCDIGAVESPGSPGQGQFACWDADQDGGCDPAEDNNGDGDCTPSDCQGQDGVACWDLNADGLCTPGSEDFTNDNQCSVLDCRGSAGTSGFSCWDLNQNHACDAPENVDGLSGCNVADCRGASGNDGFSCWDLDEDYVCDGAENRNGDAECTPADCAGPAGAPGQACWDLNGNGVCDPGSEDFTTDAQCTLLDCRGAAGLAGAACWDLNTNQICDASEDANDDTQCNVLDCRGADGFSCWDTDGDYVCDPAEDANDDTDCTVADCVGPSGVACWDLNTDGVCQPGAEDFTSDGMCTVLDCRGDNSNNGFSCWDRNMNRVCDGSEDLDSSTGCDVLDCQGPAGPQGPSGPGGDEGPAGPAGEDGTAGREALVELSEQAAGDRCEHGGVRIDSGPDLDADRVLDPAEITETAYVCNGAAGAGDAGPGSGGGGPQAIVEVEDQLPGEECEAGGKRIDSGLDADRDGALDRSEILDTDFVCNGVTGERGKKGCGCSTPGARDSESTRLAASWLLLGALVLARRRRARDRQARP